MRVKGNGSVGIGAFSTAPRGFFDVSGGVNPGSGDGAAIMLAAQSSGALNKNGGDIYLDGGQWGGGTSRYGNILLQSLYGHGNVGICKGTPAYPLDVNGNINATGYYVGGTQGITKTINYMKYPSGNGSLTFTNGILTAWS
jgi:hypothetical protein